MTPEAIALWPHTFYVINDLSEAIVTDQNNEVSSHEIIFIPCPRVFAAPAQIREIGD